jgi:hypothetical protein
LDAGSLILIPLKDFPTTFLAFFYGVGLAVAFHLAARVFQALALALTEGSLTDSSPGDRVKIGMVGIGMSPSKLGMGEIKLSKAWIQMNKMWDFKKEMKSVMTTVPYRVPFYPYMVGGYLLVSQPAGGVFKHLLQELHQVLQSDLPIGFPSRVLETAVFPARVDCFFRGMTRWASQWAATQTSVRLHSFRMLILLVRAAT